MDKMRVLRRTSLLTTLLFCLSEVCWATVTVVVTPKVEIMKGENALLPCSFTVSPPSDKNIGEWYIEEGGTRKRVAFWSQATGEGHSDLDTRLSGRVAMGPDFSLQITPVQVEDELTFICQVTAGLAGVGDASTQLKVFFAPEKPEVTGNLQAIIVGEASSSEVGQCVSKNGHPQPRIIWYKNSEPLPEVKDKKKSMYMVPSMVKEASGLYTITSALYMQPEKADKTSEFHCMVEYSLPDGQIRSKNSDSFLLTLHYPTELVTFSLVNSGPIKEGDEVKMMCETDGNPPPEFEFSRNGVNLPGEIGILTLRSVTRGNSGVYLCEALDFDAPEGVTLTQELTLEVNYMDPVKIAPSGPLSAALGDMVEMQCKTKSSAPTTLLWTKGSTVLSQSGVLNLKSVSYADAGVYTCVGEVPSVPGLKNESTITLTVTGKPTIDAPSDGVVEKEGDMVTLTCSAHGYPLPQFTWMPSGKESVNVEDNKAVSMLTLEATPEVMKEGVICTVTNKYGTDSKGFMVILKAETAETNENNESNRAERQQGGSSGVVIAVVVCVLLLLMLVSTLYFLNKKGKLPCGKKNKKEVDSNVNKDINEVEMAKAEKANEGDTLLNRQSNQ